MHLKKEKWSKKTNKSL